MLTLSAPVTHPVLFLSTMDGAPWGGSEELWYCVARRMATAVWPVAASVIKRPEAPKQLETLRGSGVTVVELATPSVPERVLRRVWPERKFKWLRNLAPRFVVLSQGSNWSFPTIEA